MYVYIAHVRTFGVRRRHGPMPRSPTGDRLRLCAATLLCAVDDDDDVVASREHARERTHGALRPERGYG